MILQALVRCYEKLAAKGTLARPGWQSAGVSFAIRIDEQGRLHDLIDLRQDVEKGKKTVKVAQSRRVPEQEKRTVGIAPNFLCDNAAYLLGIDSKGKPERAKLCFEASAQRHHALLKDVDHPFAQAILAFFDSWKPEEAAAHPLLQPCLKELATANLIFQMHITYAQDVPEIAAAWQQVYEQTDEKAPRQRCLVTGELEEIQRLHPAIKGVQDAQSMGASIVSFNAPAFESYGHDGEQGLNAPIGKHAAFAYGAALNHLLSQKEHTLYLGDTTIVFWAEDAEEEYADLFAAMMGNDNEVKDDALRDAVQRLAKGQDVRWNDALLHPSNPFYVLGLSPNAARLSVRFFIQNTFDKFAKNVARHQERMDIVKPAYDNRETLSIYSMLRETVSPNARDKHSSPHMTGDLIRAVLMDMPYPTTLYQQVQLRIRAEHEMNRGKAAIIKAYLMKNGHANERISEVTTVYLNEQTEYAPYVLGRLFALLEALQKTANPGINATIRDKYFNSASCTPSVVFPTLIRLAQAHLKKLDGGLSLHYSKRLTELMGMLGESYPKRLSLEDQGIFQLGYYHQMQKLYQKKED